MALIDFILNLAGLLLWLSWRSLRFDPLARTAPATLVGTLRRAEPHRLKGWHYLAALAALLLLRAWLYWQIGAAVNWTPHLQLGAIVLAFRSDLFGRTLLFSLFSFAGLLAVFYLWLLLLSLVNGPAADADPLQKWLRQHLGVVDRWPWLAKLFLPWIGALLLWMALSVPLAHWRILPPALSAGHRLEQAGVIGLGFYVAWKYLIGGLLALHVLNSYVYLGSHQFWTFVNSTARHLLAPLRWLPLRLGKVDFVPLLAIALVFAAAQFAERGLTLLYQRLPL